MRSIPGSSYPIMPLKEREWAGEQSDGSDHDDLTALEMPADSQVTVVDPLHPAAAQQRQPRTQQRQPRDTNADNFDLLYELWKSAKEVIVPFDGSEPWSLEDWLSEIEASIDDTVGPTMRPAHRTMELVLAAKSKLEGEAARVVARVNNWEDLQVRLKQYYRPEAAKRLLVYNASHPSFWEGSTLQQIRTRGMDYYSIIPEPALATAIIHAAYRRVPPTQPNRNKLAPDADFDEAMQVLGEMIAEAQAWGETPFWITRTSDPDPISTTALLDMDIGTGEQEPVSTHNRNDAKTRRRQGFSKHRRRRNNGRPQTGPSEA